MLLTQIALGLLQSNIQDPKGCETEAPVEVVGLRGAWFVFDADHGTQLFRVPIQNHLARCEEMVLRVARHTDHTAVNTGLA